MRRSIAERIAVLAAACFGLSGPLPPAVAQGQVLFREEFLKLDSWSEIRFEKVPRQTLYGTVVENGRSCLLVRAAASASGIVFSRSFNPYEYPLLRWSWKAGNLVQKSDPLQKDGDDYPIRMYVLFRYDPNRASRKERAAYNLARLLTGRYPPHASLNYIWATHSPGTDALPNSYSSRSYMIVADQGDAHLGQWREHEVNILEDYRRCFAQEPPAEATLAIMGDTDDTGESSIAWVDYVEIGR